MRKMKHILFLVLAAIALAACTQDELAENTALPEGAYPLVFTAVQLPPTELQTRVADEGNTTEWEDGDEIVVSMGGRQAIYTYKGGTWSSDSPLYWENTTQQTVTAWYPVDETIDFTHQDQGLAYLMKGECEGEVPFNTTAILTFTHQLAKVRVLLDGEKASEVADVTVRSYPQSANNKGELGGRIGDPVYVPMLKTEYEGKPCWEATLRDGYFEAGNTFEVAKGGGSPVRVTLTKDKIPVTAGQVTTITINVNPVIPEGTPEIDATGDINGTGAYVVRGNNRTTPINITGGSPTIYLDGATVAVGSGNAINITNNATPTIYVVGEGNTISSSNGAGIYVEEGSTVTIQGSGRSDLLKSIARSDGAGIGGSNYVMSCGNINIKNVTVYASNNNDTSVSTMCNPGIGAYRECGTITIENATVYSYATAIFPIACPAIGSRYMIPTIIISNNSEVYAYRGFNQNPSYADWIGIGGSYDGEGGRIQATVTNSTVHCYTGENLDKTVVYDGSGVGTEQ